MNDRQIKSFSINYLNFYFNARIEQLGDSWLPYPPLPPFKVTLPVHPPGETAHVIKSLPCQLIHGFINIQMCYQTGTRSSGRVGGALTLLAVVYHSINYLAAGMLRCSKQCHTSSSLSKSSEYARPIIKHVASKEWRAADFTCRDNSDLNDALNVFGKLRVEEKLNVVYTVTVSISLVGFTCLLPLCPK